MQRLLCAQCFDKIGLSRVVGMPFWGEVADSSVQGRQNEKGVDVAHVEGVWVVDKWEVFRGKVLFWVKYLSSIQSCISGPRLV